MASALPLFRTIGHQLLIVALVILSLPIVVRILWKLRLFPLGCYFVATKLFCRAGRKHTEQSAFLIFFSFALFFLP